MFIRIEVVLGVGVYVCGLYTCYQCVGGWLLIVVERELITLIELDKRSIVNDYTNR